MSEDLNRDYDPESGKYSYEQELDYEGVVRIIHTDSTGTILTAPLRSGFPVEHTVIDLDLPCYTGDRKLASEAPSEKIPIPEPQLPKHRFLGKLPFLNRYFGPPAGEHSAEG